MLAGFGKPAHFDGAAAERLAATVLGRLLVGGEETLTFALDAQKGGKLDDAELAAHLALGAYLRGYRFDHYRKVGDDEKPTIKKVVVVTKTLAAAKALWEGVSAVGEGVHLARDLVNEPPNVLYPEEAAKRTLALRKLGVRVEVFGVEEMQKLGMNTLLGVGQGSSHESRMVVMQWNGGDTATEYKMLMRTFISVFPYTTLWGDGSLMLGSLKPFTLSRTPSKLVSGAPEYGEHTDAILGELGLSASDIAELRQSGTI